MLLFLMTTRLFGGPQYPPNRPGLWLTLSLDPADVMAHDCGPYAMLMSISAAPPRNFPKSCALHSTARNREKFGNRESATSPSPESTQPPQKKPKASSPSWSNWAPWPAPLPDVCAPAC